MFLASDPVPADFIQFVGKNSKCFVKLTGVYRISTAPRFADAAPLAKR